jgi:hypothetical protein
MVVRWWVAVADLPRRQGMNPGRPPIARRAAELVEVGRNGPFCPILCGAVFLARSVVCPAILSVQYTLGRRRKY